MSGQFRPIASAIASLPGLTIKSAPSFAAWPVWAGSKRKPVAFDPIPKKLAFKLFHKARQFDRSTHDRRRHGGKLGHSGLQVLHALIFDFLNFRTGRLDPSYEAIARRANLARSTVAAALRRLRDLRIIDWVTRCFWDEKDGRLAQDTNAYAIAPAEQWRGFRDIDPPPLDPASWGAAPPLAFAIDQAVQDMAAGLSVEAATAALDADPGDKLAAALARLGRSIAGRDSSGQ